METPQDKRMREVIAAGHELTVMGWALTEECDRLEAENERLRELVREAYQEGRVSEDDSLLRESTRAATSAWESSEVRRKLDSE